MATSSKGFALLELIVGLAIFLFMLVISLPMWEGFLQISEMVKIDSACRLLATDIADIQNKSLFRNLEEPAYVIMLDRYGDGYTIIKNQTTVKNVRFSELGLDSVVATCANTNKISFSTTGSPQRAVSINVYSRNNNLKRKYVEVQPVTGRIVITDETT
ncbi:MAG: Tfp pilus assembly protein FimT/FimU [Acidaminococcaceae bacterium]